MTKYLSGSFSVGFGGKAFESGYEQTFGKKPEHLGHCSAYECADGCPVAAAKTQAQEKE